MERFELEGSGGRPIRAVRHGSPDAPPVLVLHGFKGFKDWGMFPWIAETLADAGFSAVRFDFSHNGVEVTDFDRLDLFLLDTWTRHQEDLRAILGGVDGPVSLLGHSRGGADALLFAASEPRVRKVATLAAVANTMIPDDAEEVVRRLGYYPIPNARTKQTMPMARTAFEDAASHSIEDAARRMQQPLLLVHGTADESVPFDHAGRLAAWHGDAEVVGIEGAGHTFGAVHPFAGPTPALTQALERVTTFLAPETE